MRNLQHEFIGPPMLDPLTFWPKEKPSVPALRHGWFSEQNKVLLRRLLDDNTKCIIELGSWLGESTRFMLDHTRNALVFAIDTWKGGPDHQDPDSEWFKMLPTLYQTFLVNMWEYRKRLIPMRTSTQIGLDVIYEDGLYKPDLIYIDADHSYDAVCADIERSYHHFPEALLVGDDWGWGHDLPVQRAVKDMAEKLGLKYHVEGGWAWTYYK
jgi:hypothetical protein